MDAIRRIVSEIIFMCRSRGVQVSDTLGAFMARAIVLENAELFPLDKELNESDVQELIRLATERLLDRDSPSLETVKMQVAFDSARVLETEAFARSRADKDASEGVLVGEICAARLRPPDDVEALTNLYRKIFNFLVVRAGIAPGSNRAAEREIAAALESVFPRIGLKAFTGLSGDDKAAQLVELANIVLGIRLFNRHIGKGGVAISDRPGEAANMAYGLLAQVGKELAAAHTLCEQYSGVIAHKYRGGAARPVRLQEELTNRRQYVALLTQTDEGLKQAAEHVDQLTHMLLQEMETVQDLVGARTSVPKEQVYPRFDTLAKLWLSFDEEIVLLEARKATLAALHQFRDSYTPTLSPADVVASRAAARAGASDDRALPEDSVATARAVAAGGGAATEAPPEPVMVLTGAELQSAQMELDGFCPVTIAERDGLLLPASRSYLARHRDRVYGFVDEASLEAFVASPDAYVRAVLAMAKKAPELIHMLRLQEFFPAASIAEIMRQHAQAVAGGGSLLAPIRMTQDGAAQTVDHPEEASRPGGSLKDPSYEWNEWALRRRALQLANLRNKKTTSSQTDASALRREQETQVYLLKEGSTMTSVSTGTSVPVSKNYIAGLRGGPEARVEVVNMTFDMDTVIGKYR